MRQRIFPANPCLGPRDLPGNDGSSRKVENEPDQDKKEDFFEWGFQGLMSMIPSRKDGDSFRSPTKDDRHFF